MNTTEETVDAIKVIFADGTINAAIADARGILTVLVDMARR